MLISRLREGDLFKTWLTDRYGVVEGPASGASGGVRVAFDDDETKVLHPNVVVELVEVRG